jgi:hypothetical protein
MYFAVFAILIAAAMLLALARMPLGAHDGGEI